MRVTFLKPLSAAVSIGTGGPFGAEGPIIATGGALGSLVGQIVTTTAAERKTLLAAGAAAGMAATFGTPLAAVLLAVELLLFEYRPQSLIPLALATITAALGRAAIEGQNPVFAMGAVPAAGLAATIFYVVMGALLGVVAVGVTRVVYFIEDAFERLPFHFMWWPVLGGLAVGLVGLVAPRTLGIGYQNLDELAFGSLTWQAAAFLGAMKFVSWSVSLGSGTSGGTLAPLLTIGGCLGTAIAAGVAMLFPQLGLHVPTAAVVGMAALFAGAARAPLASALFAFEATREVAVITPLLGGCMLSYLVSCRLMRNSIMTEKIARRGIKAPTEYTADVLDQVLVRDVATKSPVVLHSDQTVANVRDWLGTATAETKHQGYPVVDQRGGVLGVVTRRELLNGVDGSSPLRKLVRRTPIVVYDDCSVREAVEHMMRHEVGRLPVMTRSSPSKLVGIITRSDVLTVYSGRGRST
jgi:H+/Cl- antiporter ClcA/CBS domain-containing protein